MSSSSLPPPSPQFQLSSGVKTVAADGTTTFLAGAEAASQLIRQGEVVAPILQASFPGSAPVLTALPPPTSVREQQCLSCLATA